MSCGRSRSRPAPDAIVLSVVVATRNEHKLEELREILEDCVLEPLPAEVQLPPEDGSTFAENALTKARAAHAATGKAAIGDDSGIEARALGGRPGIYSARFAGHDATDRENLDLLLRQLEAEDDRSVAFVCVIAFVDADGNESIHEGRWTGVAAPEPKGSNGFGYDPIFLPDDIGDGRTAAEIDPAEKHAISHRGRAVRALRDALGS